MSLSKQIEELEEELDEALHERRRLEDIVSTLENDIQNTDDAYDELQEQFNSFIAYVEQLAPGAHNAWLIANKLEG